jgi:hypothetical protein
MRQLFKTDRAGFNRLHDMKVGREKEAREKKAAWAEKHQST